MSSLAAVQADGFYYPTDFDPKKHKSLNAYHGTHALRERAAKIDQGILVVRFEVPFHIWCDKCGEKIAKGERFNADKKAIGMYHSTKILQFSMRHHCGCLITIQTDPKNAEYIVVEGAKKKVEGVLDAGDRGVLELMDDTEKERLALDPLYRLEQGEASRKRARTAAEEVEELLEDARAKHADAYATNAQLRAKMRVARKEAEALELQRKTLNLPDGLALLPHSEEDTQAAALAFYEHDASGRSANQAAQRQAILNQPIFPPAQRSHRSPRHTGPALPPAGAGPSHPQGGATERSGDSDDLVDPSTGSAAQRRPAGAGHERRSEHQQQHRDGNSKKRCREDEDAGADGGVGSKAVAVRDPWAVRVVAEQPGASSGKPVPQTQAGLKERAKTVQAARDVAQKSVAAWRAGRASVGKGAGTATGHNGGGSGGGGSGGGGGGGAVKERLPPADSGAAASALKRASKKPSAATLLKAQVLAKRQREAGIRL